MSRRWGAAAAALLCALLFTSASQAGSLRFCDRPLALSADQKDKLFRLGGVIKDELARSGQRIALVSRSGLDLSRFGQRYSHAGFSLQASPETPWAVRQLYYACDEQRPLLFDQGMAGFLLGTNDPAIGYVSVVFLPDSAAAPLEQAVLDKPQALQLLGATYSANAYAFGLRYQNCNQWVAEMLGTAWNPSADKNTSNPRLQAQRWLEQAGYTPSRFDIGDRLLMGLATAVVPWLHSDDHPGDDLHEARYRISMPAAIEAFIHDTVPGARRVEFCHNQRHIVIRHGWTQIPEGCEPGEQDRVVLLD